MFVVAIGCGDESADRMFSGSAKWKAFSTAEHLALKADNSWEASKERGNTALKQGDYLRAAELYQESALIALGPLEGGIIDAFISALESWPVGSAHAILAENIDVVWANIVPKLPIPPLPRTMDVPDGEELEGAYPNKGAAIAWSNRAQALLQAGDPKEALICARRATAANPVPTYTQHTHSTQHTAYLHTSPQPTAHNTSAA